VRHADARAFLERAGAWLLEREAEHNLILGIAESLVKGDHTYESPIYLATVEEGGEVVGCAWRTPPFKVGVTDMPLSAIRAVVADVAELYHEIGAVLGVEPVAEAFALEWARLRGAKARPGMRQRIYALTEVARPRRPPPGRMRRAVDEDGDRLTQWWEAFQVEVGMTLSRDARAAVDRGIAAGHLLVWVDDDVVSLAGAGSRTPHGVRVGPVYTPPSERGRGYATALVADLSQRLLDQGRKVCFLYTDLANPTSNSIYTQIGYLPVADVRDFLFE
jgi:predicted GNAT family acetyltransferase